MASIQRTVDKSDRVPEFFDLDSMEVDGQNLIFHLNRANANMAGSLADPLFLIVDTNVDDSAFAMEGPICTGPYKVEVVDQGTRDEVMNHPTSDYTKKLLAAVPEMEGRRFV